MKKHLWVALGMLLATAFLVTETTQAQVPEDIEAGLLKIGHVVDPPCTAKLYRSEMPPKDIVDQLAEMQTTGKPSTQVSIYPGITVSRDVSFGPNAKDVVDIFTADKGPISRPVLMYVPGGAGNKIELQDKEANAFYDNIARWATENGMVGVLMQRHGAAPAAAPAPGAPPDPPDFYAGAKDVSAMIKWVQENISKYHGNPNQMFIWAQSAGNGPLGIYIGHPELYPPKGVGVKGVIFMSGQFSILRPDGTNPLPLPQPGAAGAGGGRGGAGGGGGAPAAGATRPAGAGAPGGAPAAGGAQAAGGGGRGGAAPSVCGVAGGNGGTDGALPGRAPGQPGGPNVANAGGGGRGGAPAVSQEELIKRSSLPALEKTDVKLFLASAGLDPGVDGNLSPFNRALHDELCKLDGANAKDGVGHCPKTLFELGESHMSEVFSIDTPDKTVSGPILAWIKGIRSSLVQKDKPATDK